MNNASLHEVAPVMDHQPPDPAPVSALSRTDLRKQREDELRMRVRTVYMVLCGVARLNGETDRNVADPGRQGALWALAEQAVLSVDPSMQANAEARIARVLHEDMHARVAAVKAKWRDHPEHATIFRALDDVPDTVKPGSTIFRALAEGLIAAYRGSFCLPVREDAR